ncbi:LytTR family transcriptional regulator [[Clostridium] hylemonae]|uniref:LytTR family transcriptional regulator DNA-binding domain-containing protein n=1 Tax=[Clostridium] hylemonae TaxID=89153 RepID=UPI001D072EB2|nr:LytTR family DNA-binding domain-containing protein [[Clostridium] hylemonae]MCB7522824.1 LytTR family transcriptional regulator [[Clostridium] hylemonae]
MELSACLSFYRSRRFLRVHRSHIINLDHVVAVLRDRVAMRDDALLPIRRGRRRKCAGPGRTGALKS